MNLRFEFRVLNEGGDCIATDWTTFSPQDIDINGSVETVEIHTGSTLRYLRRKHLAGKLEETA